MFERFFFGGVSLIWQILMLFCSSMIGASLWLIVLGTFSSSHHSFGANVSMAFMGHMLVGPALLFLYFPIARLLYFQRANFILFPFVATMISMLCAIFITNFNGEVSDILFGFLMFGGAGALTGGIHFFLMKTEGLLGLNYEIAEENIAREQEE